MTPRVELIYTPGCPHVESARNAVLQAFVEAGLEPAWTEWNRRSAASPPYARQYGSPTILVEGRDVTGAAPAEGAECCRVYRHGPGILRGVPPVAEVAAALRSHSETRPGIPTARPTRGWWRALALLPGAGATLLPVGACPACWPAYAGVLGSLGLGFLARTPYRLPVMAALLGLTLFALGFRARQRRGYGPLLLGTISVAVVLLFPSATGLSPLAYGGLGGLIAASIWNAWPAPRGGAAPCPACPPERSPSETPAGTNPV